MMEETLVDILKEVEFIHFILLCSFIMQFVMSATVVIMLWRILYKDSR